MSNENLSDEGLLTSPWKEYPSPKQIPANEGWSGTAYLWNRPKSPVVIDVEGLGEDFSDSAFYCFDNSGKLLSLEHEFRTAWGWGCTEKSNLTGQERKQPSVGELHVKVAESGSLIRFNYRVLDPEKTAALNDKKAEPFVVRRAGRVKRVVPQMEKV